MIVESITLFLVLIYLVSTLWLFVLVVIVEGEFLGIVCIFLFPLVYLLALSNMKKCATPFALSCFSLLGLVIIYMGVGESLG